MLLPKKFDYELYNLTGSYDFGGFSLISSPRYIGRPVETSQPAPSQFSNDSSELSSPVRMSW